MSKETDIAILDATIYRKLRVAKDKFVYVFFSDEDSYFYDEHLEKSVASLEKSAQRLGKNGKLVRTNRVIKLVSQNLEAVGLHGSKVYYPELARNIVRAYYTENWASLLSEMDMKRLANAKFKIAVRGNETFFYDLNLERLDCFIEKLIKHSLEKAVCPY